MAGNKRLSQRSCALVLGVAAISVLGVLAPEMANANGGGGGGGLGGAMPRTSQRTINPAESFREGLEALDAGDYRKAEKKFGEVLEAAPDHPQANYYMGMAKVGQGKDKSARRYFERAVKELPNFVDAREQLALLYVRLGQTDKCQEQLAALKDLQAQCATGACGDAATRLNDAVANVETALADASSAAPAEDGGKDEDDDVSAVEDSPRHFAHLFLRPREEGVEHYRDAVRLINEARYEEAIVDLQDSQAIVGPHPDILNYLGFAHRKLGLFDKAKHYYGQALAIDPEHLGANEYLGELYLELGEIGKAKRQLARLDRLCDFGCVEREELARLIAIKETVRSAAQ